MRKPPQHPCHGSRLGPRAGRLSCSADRRSILTPGKTTVHHGDGPRITGPGSPGAPPGRPACSWPPHYHGAFPIIHKSAAHQSSATARAQGRSKLTLQPHSISPPTEFDCASPLGPLAHRVSPRKGSSQGCGRCQCSEKIRQPILTTRTGRQRFVWMWSVPQYVFPWKLA